MSGSVISPSGGQVNSRTTKQTQFLHRNSNPNLPTSAQIPPSNLGQKEGEKIKKHKYSKSREFYGSGVVN